MTTKKQEGLSLDQLHELFSKHDVKVMSSNIFGISYGELQTVLYPRPRYKSFEIKKRNGSPRKIFEPYLVVKDLQYKALEYLKAKARPAKACVHGFVDNRSIVTNARKHIERRPYHILNLDIEDFFPSISFYRVRGALMKPPFNLSFEVATVFTQLCTLDNHLPQGAPTSPFLSNLICRSLDSDLMALAKQHRANYTRYADDITFSFSTRDSANLPSNIVTYDSGVLKIGLELQETIETKHSFKINPAKTRMSTRRHRMEVTGITTNEFPNIKRKFIDTVRGALHAWESYGYGAAQKSWEERIENGKNAAYEKRPWKRQTRTGTPPQLKNVLWGKLLYIRMVRGNDDVIYTRLAEKYNRLSEQETFKEGSFQYSSLPIEAVVRNAEDAELGVYVIQWEAEYKPPGKNICEFIGAQGTAFAYRDLNTLITCDHVFGIEITYENEGKSITEQLRVDSPGVELVRMYVHNPKLKVNFEVNLTHSDSDRDLAILRFKGNVPANRYFSSLDSTANRNETGMLIGFPNWNPGRPADLAKTVFTNVFPRRALLRIEISALIRKGNSGGPLVDNLFRVVGIAQEGALQDSGNNECLAVTVLDHWLATLG